MSTTMIESVHVVADSGNSKTGRIPVTHRPMTTCPSTCPFLPTGPVGGCYATGRIFGMADRYSGSITLDDAVARVRKGMHAGARYLRDRVAGDVVTAAGRLDRAYVAAITTVATSNGLTPFGYTHAWRTFTPADRAWLQSSGYVMNASTETPAGAARAVRLGMPTVIANGIVPEGTMIEGKRVVTCPAQTRDDVSCASCGLCAKPNRSCIIRFMPHGSAVRKAERAIRESE